VGSGGDDRPRRVTGMPTAATIYTDKLMNRDTVSMSSVVSGKRRPSQRQHRIGSLVSEAIYAAYDRGKRSPIGETAIEEHQVQE
jgi:hypothetical protein